MDSDVETQKSATPIAAIQAIESNQLSLSISTVADDDEPNSYLHGLLGDGVKTQVDVDVDAYELQLPPWYDDEKFKRYVDIKASISI